MRTYCIAKGKKMYNLFVGHLFVVVESLSHVRLFCNLMDYSLPGSSVHGISQTRTLEWVAISFSKGSSPPKDQTHVFCIGRKILYHWASLVAQLVKNPPVMQETLVLFLGQEDPLEKGMATRSNILGLPLRLSW